jgi:hypothetical protein
MIKQNTMKEFLLVALAAILTTSSFGQKTSKDNVPQSVQDALKKSFPTAQVEKWEKENQNFEAEFDFNKEEMSALFSPEGKLIETEVDIAIGDLPTPIVNYVSKNLSGKKIKEASKITNSAGNVSFEAEVGGKDYIFDSSGNLLKSE